MKKLHASHHSCTLLVTLALGCGIALAAPPVAQSTDADIAGIMQIWQSRILAERLPVTDPANWAKRNMAKFSRFSEEQVDMALGAATLGELELLLMDAPVPNGTRLGLVLASHPNSITMIAAGNSAKLTPTSDPSAYADLAFTALTPCRIYDSRPSQSGPGTWLAGSTNTINVGPNSSYAFQGGSATNCGMPTLAGPSQIAAVLASVSTVNQASAGYLTFFSNGATNPFPFGVTQSYQPGSVQTSFVVIPTDLVATVLSSGFTSAQTNVIVDVVGYFAKAKAAALECLTPTAGTTTAVTAGNTSAFIYSDICALGYTSTGGSCSSTSSNMYLMASGASNDNAKHYCQYRNSDASSQNATATNKCCRTAGR